MASSSAWTRSRSVLALAALRGAPPDEIERLRRDYVADRAEYDLQRLVQRDPPLTGPQLARLQLILATAAVAGTHAD